MARALNDESGIRPEVRQNILQVAKELGYQPNVLGKALRSTRQTTRFAVIMHQNEFLDVVRDGMQRASQELTDFGVELLYYDYNKMDYREQLALLQQVPPHSVAGVIIKPIDHPQIRDAINRLVEQDIPVITVNSDIESSKRLCYIGQDLFRGGQIAGNLMGKILGSQGKIVIFQEDDEGSSSFSERSKGLQEELRKHYSNIRVAAIIPIHENEPTNYNLALEYLHKNADIDGICVIGSSHTEIGKALRDSGNGKRIKMICFDIFNETRDLTRNGIIDFVITQSPITQGIQAVKTLFDVVFSDIMPNGSKIYVPTRVKERYTIEE